MRQHQHLLPRGSVGYRFLQLLRIVALLAVCAGCSSGPVGNATIDPLEFEGADQFWVSLYASDVKQGMVDGVSVRPGALAEFEGIPVGKWHVFIQALGGPDTTLAHTHTEIEVLSGQTALAEAGPYRPGMPGDEIPENGASIESFGPDGSALLTAVYGPPFEGGDALPVSLEIQSGSGPAVEADDLERSPLDGPLLQAGGEEHLGCASSLVAEAETELTRLAAAPYLAQQVTHRYSNVAPGGTVRLFIATTFREVECVRLLTDQQTEHCLIFSEVVNGATVLSPERAVEIAEAFDRANPFSPTGGGIYEETRERFGSEWRTNPLGGRDGDERVVLVFLSSPSIGGQGLFGFFRPADERSKAEAPTSNEGEILYINGERAMSDLYDGLVTVAHELSHLILYNQKVVQDGAFPEGARQETTVLDEGLAVLNEELSGFGLTGEQGGNGFLLMSLQACLESGLRHGFFDFQSRLSSYGSGYLFWRYLHDQFGPPALRELTTSTQIGMANVEEGLGVPFSYLFLDFVQATALEPGDPRPESLTYQNLDLFGEYPVRGGETVTLRGLQGQQTATLPGSVSAVQDLPPWSATLYRVDGGDGSPLTWRASGGSGLITEALDLSPEPSGP